MVRGLAILILTMAPGYCARHCDGLWNSYPVETRATSSYLVQLYADCRNRERSELVSELVATWCELVVIEDKTSHRNEKESDPCRTTRPGVTPITGAGRLRRTSPPQERELKGHQAECRTAPTALRCLDINSHSTTLGCAGGIWWRRRESLPSLRRPLLP